jgi:nicotinamidase-related amidase
MDSNRTLIVPNVCTVLLVDLQAGLGFAIESAGRQTLINNATALARTAVIFGVPVVATTSASKVFGGPMLPQIQSVLPDVKPIERRNMNAWEDPTVKNAVQGLQRKRLLVAGFLTEACVSFPTISALAEGYEVLVVADACGGLTETSHQLALRRLEQAGATLTSWIQVLLEFQRDWTRHESYEAARSIVVDHAGGYGMGLAYAREMIHAA